MKLFLCLITMIFVFGCVQKRKGYDRYRERISNEITYKVAMQVKKEKNLIPCGTGGGGVGKLRMLYLAFNYYDEIEVEEARTLLIEASNLFLKTINEDVRIRPYLSNFPFEPKNIEMAIFFCKSNHQKVEDDNLSILSLEDAKLSYKINDPATNFLKTILIETYEEAQEKVKEQSVCRGLKC